ncbi:MAG: flagellar biosynthetic protein FliP [Micavibrio aeruginosavorus]|uniref:Flagellar biosynthetic protein FliP n=1 Tax=Micavibrio aeruginosavorus TaxID=349221 RepID=A0A2W5FMG6_9BACT|nr:MAG: flagellar biosynthetic protein FliP [Micavibrio aeruginosavorus]
MTLSPDRFYSFCKKYGMRLLMAFAIVNTIMLAGVLYNPALAQVISMDLGGSNPGTVSGTVIQLMALMTVLSLAPSILIMMTSFTRIIVVLSFLRSALGLQQTPPNTVMISLAMFLTFFIMAPTFEAAYNQGIKPLIAEEIDEVEAFNRSVGPFKEFMLRNVREADLRLFMEVSKTPAVEDPLATPIQVVVPAFMISELRRAFEIGFMLFLPFLVIDIVTSSILMSMGMMMLPPIVISLPFKIIFFVLVDGWNLIAGALIQSFDMPPDVGPAMSAPPLAPGATPSP